MQTGMCEPLTELNMFRAKLKDSSTQQIWTWNLQKYENSASPLSAPEPGVILDPLNWTNQLLQFDYINTTKWQTLTHRGDCSSDGNHQHRQSSDGVCHKPLKTRWVNSLKRKYLKRKKRRAKLDDIIRSGDHTPDEQTDLYDEQVGETKTDR